jgi:hypothetical protein
MSDEKYKFSLILQKEKQKMDEKARTFALLSSEWEIHLNPEWRRRWITEAEK